MLMIHSVVEISHSINSAHKVHAGKHPVKKKRIWADAKQTETTIIRQIVNITVE